MHTRRTWPILKIGQGWKVGNKALRAAKLSAQLSEAITTVLVSFNFDALFNFPLDVQLLEWADGHGQFFFIVRFNIPKLFSDLKYMRLLSSRTSIFYCPFQYFGVSPYLCSITRPLIPGTPVFSQVF
jgi:hypothetical protein